MDYIYVVVAGFEPANDGFSECLVESNFMRPCHYHLPQCIVYQFRHTTMFANSIFTD